MQKTLLAITLILLIMALSIAQAQNPSTEITYEKALPFKPHVFRLTAKSSSGKVYVILHDLGDSNVALQQRAIQYQDKKSKMQRSPQPSGIYPPELTGDIVHSIIQDTGLSSDATIFAKVFDQSTTANVALKKVEKLKVNDWDTVRVLLETPLKTEKDESFVGLAIEATNNPFKLKGKLDRLHFRPTKLTSATQAELETVLKKIISKDSSPEAIKIEKGQENIASVGEWTLRELVLPYHDDHDMEMNMLAYLLTRGGKKIFIRYFYLDDSAYTGRLGAPAGSILTGSILNSYDQVIIFPETGSDCGKFLMLNEKNEWFEKPLSCQLRGC